MLVVPKQEPHGFNPISPSKVLCELFAAEVDPNGYSVTFDKASAAAVKDHFAEADKADVGADAIGLTAAGSMASAPTNPGVASMNPDVMEEPPQSRRVVEAECALEAAEDDADATAEELAEARLRVDAECDLALALALDGSWEKGRKCNASEDDVGAKVTALGALCSTTTARFTVTPPRREWRSWTNFYSARKTAHERQRHPSRQMDCYPNGGMLTFSRGRYFRELMFGCALLPPDCI